MQRANYKLVGMAVLPSKTVENLKLSLAIVSPLQTDFLFLI